MLDNINEILEKFSPSILNKLNRDNFDKIVKFLKNEGCECIDDIIEDYIDIFTIEYTEFQKKYVKLNDKYSNQYLKLVSEDMNYLEEIFNDF